MNPIHVLRLERVGFDPKSFLHVHGHRRGLSILKAISLCFIAFLLKMYDQMIHFRVLGKNLLKISSFNIFHLSTMGLGLIFIYPTVIRSSDLRLCKLKSYLSGGLSLQINCIGT